MEMTKRILVKYDHRVYGYHHVHSNMFGRVYINCSNGGVNGPDIDLLSVVSFPLRNIVISTLGHKQPYAMNPLNINLTANAIQYAVFLSLMKICDPSNMTNNMDRVRKELTLRHNTPVNHQVTQYLTLHPDQLRTVYEELSRATLEIDVHFITLSFHKFLSSQFNVHGISSRNVIINITTDYPPPPESKNDPNYIVHGTPHSLHSLIDTLVNACNYTKSKSDVMRILFLDYLHQQDLPHLVPE